MLTYCPTVQKWRVQLCGLGSVGLARTGWTWFVRPRYTTCDTATTEAFGSVHSGAAASSNDLEMFPASIIVQAQITATTGGLLATLSPGGAHSEGLARYSRKETSCSYARTLDHLAVV